MWRMLCARGKDLAVDASAIAADDATGRAHWVATYTYSATGRRVVNRIDARFAFRDGLHREARGPLRPVALDAAGAGVEGPAAGLAAGGPARRAGAGGARPRRVAGATSASPSGSPLTARCRSPAGPVASPIHRQANRTAHELPARTPVHPRPRAARSACCWSTSGRPTRRRRRRCVAISRNSSPTRAWSRFRVRCGCRSCTA